ncbi:MAG: DsrE/DsrF/DrsH-like family protein [Armatimonadota bacterium]|nr:DsrE/DsrF/DrsH-like family protein [Armatimonadota bacterium]MDR7402210.1 DsrE/DsrF/DrsH-like family protein [Armatimonadota bacterium]MDR7403338.1 DsrE/DsrF/DrsH-like family protein [Armatimonadota bacterium]MDR7436966.1 DsrE/DsrF/DrsH-like family protein [Armatimonadota bacterium]MDR7472260.1 DsrE/DsrF/DrsH-like family protein [Armatimonadota bacterium]
MADRLSMIVFSGTVDKLFPVAILASGAVAMEQEVDIFLTFWGLEAFRRGAPQQNMRFSKDFEDKAPAMLALMQQKQVPSWYETLRKAKELGNGKLRIHACAMTMDLMGLTKDDLDPIVDDVVGVGEFVEEAQKGKITLFI